MSSVDITAVVIQAKSDGIDSATSSLNKLSDAADRAEASTGKFGNTTSTTNNTAKQVTSAVDNLLAKYQKQVDLLGANVSQQNAYNVALKGGNEAQIASAQQLGAQSDAYKRLAQDQAQAIAMNEKLAESAGHVSGGASGITRELIVLGHEASQGNFSRFGGSMVVMAEKINFTEAAMEKLGKAASSLGLSTGGLITIIALIGTAIATVSLAIDHYINQQQAFNAGIINTGNYAGTSAAQLTEMAAAATASGGSIGEANKAVLQLASSGKFTSDQIGMITNAAVAMEHATGTSVEKTIEQFEALATESINGTQRSTDAIAKAALKANDSLHYLTADIYAQIVALEKAGEAQSAVALSIGALADETERRAKQIEDSLGFLPKMWATLKNDIGQVINSIGQLGATGVTALQLQRTALQKEMDALKTNTVLPDQDTLGSYGAPDNTAKIAAINTKIIALDVQLEAAKTAAAKQGQEARLEQDKIHAQQRMGVLQDQYDKTKKATTQLEDYEQDFEKQSQSYRAANWQTYADTRLALIKASQGKIKAVRAEGTAGINEQLSEIKTVTDAQQDAYNSDLKSLENLYKNKMVTISDYENQKDRLLNAEVDNTTKGYKDEVAALNTWLAASNRTDTEILEGKSKLQSLQQSYNKTLASEKEQIALNLTTYEDSVQKQILAAQESSDKVVKSDQAKTKAIQDQIDAYNSLPQAARDAGVTEKQMADTVTQAKIQDLQKEIDAENEKGMAARSYNAELIAQNQQQIDAANKLKAAQTAQISQQNLNTFNLGFAARAKSDAADAVAEFQAAGKEIEGIFTDMFGKSMKPLSDFFKAFTDGLAAETAATEKLNKVKEEYKDADILQQNMALHKAQDQLDEASAKNSVKFYGDMAGAASQFFSTSSTGYKTLQAVSEVFHAAELAMTIASNVQKGIGAILNQGTGDPYSAFARMAAMAAIVAGLGVAISGAMGGNSGTPVSSAQQQAVQGTGSVLGDVTAKTDSIVNSLKTIELNSGLGLVHDQAMENYLKTIANSLSGLASLIVRTTGLTSNTAIAGVTIGTSLTSTSGGIGLTGLAGDIFAPAVGAITGVLAKLPVLGGLITKLFGTTTSVIDQGIAGFSTSLANVQSIGIQAQTYANVQSTSKFFGITTGSSTSTQFGALPQEISDQFTLIVKNLADGVTAAAKVLGMDGDGFAAHLQQFVVDVGNISLKGLTGDQIQTALENVFSKIGDDMAQFGVAGLAQFQKVGEGYLDTLTRVANDLTQVQDVFAVLGKQMNSTGIEAVTMSEGLINAFGSIDNLTSATQEFVKDFETPAEAIAPIADSVTKAMASLGESSITTIDQFEKLVMSQDLTTAAGQQMYAALLNIAPAFKQVSDAATQAATDAAKAVSDALALTNKAASDSFNVLSASINKAKTDSTDAFSAYSISQNALITASQATSDAMAALTGALQGALNALNPLLVSTNQSTAQANQVLSDALTTAQKTGVLPTSDSLTEALSTLSKPDDSSYTSSTDYKMAVGITAGKIADLNNIAVVQKTVAQQQLDTEKQQLALATTAYNNQQNAYNQLLADAQQQMDAMNGTQIAVESLVAALTNFNASVNAAIAASQKAGTIANNNTTAVAGQASAPQVASTQQIIGDYQNILGRTPSAAEIAFQENAVQQGNWSAASLAQFFYNSPEYLAAHPAINGSHAKGLDSVPFDGYTAKLHKGEMVLPAKQAQGVAQGSDMQDVVVAVNTSVGNLNNTVSTMQSDIRWLKKLFQTMTPNGQSLQTTAGPA